MARRTRKPSSAAAKRFMKSCKTSSHAEDTQQQLESLESQLETLESHVDGIEEDLNGLKEFRMPRTDLKHLQSKLSKLRAAFALFKWEVGTAVYDANEAADLLNMKEQGFDLT